MRQDYCVYLHLDKEGVVRYVGSGGLKRPSRTNNRNKKWHELFDNNLFTVEIVAKDLSKKDSLGLESELIEKYKYTVVNARTPSHVKELEYDYFSKLFEISEESPSGLIWKVSSGRWGRIPAGTCAGSISGGKKKYWLIHAKDFSVSVHRIVYLLKHGDIDSSLVINHIDGNGLNNKPENLEQVTQSINVHKSPKPINPLSSNVTVRCHKGIPSRVVARFCFEPNKETHKNFGVRACGSLENAIKLAKEWREAAERGLLPENKQQGV